MKKSLPGIFRFIIIFIISIALPTCILAQPTNDDCAGATPLGTLGNPGPCGSGIKNGSTTTISTSNVGATPENPYTTLAGCGMASPANDVWYSFVAPARGYGVNLQISNATFPDPDIALWTGSCGSLTGIGCIVGSGGSATLNIPAGIVPGQTYYIQVSGGTGESGTFDLSANAFQNCDDCLNQATLTVSPQPTNGTYQPGQTVDFCFQVNQYTQVNQNWLHGIQISFGNGWNLSSLTTTPSAALGSSGGTWAYYPNGITASNGTNWPPGFYFDLDNDGNPGNNFGDSPNGASGVTITTSGSQWLFCWTITVKPGCNPGASLTVNVSTSGDGESGAWTNSGCANDPTTSFNALIACCPPNISATNVSCYGANDGTATATPVGNAGPYTYNWTGPGGYSATNSNVSGPNTITGLAPGTYSVSVTDADLCSSDTSIIITQPTEITLSTNATTATCGNSNGSASVTASGGVPGYTYSWAPSGETGSTASNLAGGTYTVTVTDNTGCVKTAVVTVPSTPAVTAGFTQSPNQCLTGNSFTFTNTGTSGSGATYSWDFGGAAASPATSTAQNPTVTYSTPGTYTITQTISQSGCTATQTSTVNVYAPPTLTISNTNVSCNGGSDGSATVTASPAGSYNYSWAPSGGTGSTASGLSAGTYTVTATDANGCTATASISISEPPALTATTSQTNVSCNSGSDGSATATASGGTSPYTYSWSNGATGTTATGLSAGTYTVTITDSKSCSTTQTVTITEPSGMTLTTSSTAANCGQSNGAASVTASGGTSPYTYSWNPGGQTTSSISNVAAGTYSVTVTDDAGCPKTTTVTISNTSGPTATLTSSTNVLCNGGSTGSAAVSVTGGASPLTYAWTPSGGSTTTANNLSAGTYTFTVTDNNGCASTVTATITQPPALAVTTSHNNVTCNGGNNGSATVNATGGTSPYTYSWTPSGGSTSNATGLSAGVYTVTVTDANNCSISSTITITQPTALSLTTSATDATCGNSNGQASVSVSGGTSPYTYTWTPGSQTSNSISNLSAGTYTVTVTDSVGCQKTASVAINNLTGATVSISSSDVLCNGGNTGSATATVSGGATPLTYAWSPSGGTTTTANNLTAGTYTITITDNNGCITTATTTISEPTALTATTSSMNAHCTSSDGSAGINVSGGTSPYTYSWSTGGQTTDSISNVVSGVYPVTVSDANGCTLNDTITVNQTPGGTATISSQTYVTCNGANDGTATVSMSGNGTPPYTYLWTPGNQTTVTATNLGPGTYTVNVTDQYGCKSFTSVTINEPPILAATPSQTNIACNRDSTGTASVAVSGGTPGYTYSWSPGGQTTDSISNLPAGSYSCLITDANNCTKNVSIAITQPPAIVLTTSSSPAHCGQSDGSASVSASGGAAPYSYLWSPGGYTTNSASGLSANTYNVTVTDANGCSETASVTVSNIAGPVATITSSANVKCNGNNDGNATVAVTGGTSPYNFLWSNGQAQPTATNLTAGTYTVNITDSTGCTISTSVTITQPTALAATTSSTDPSCNNYCNGKAQINVTGGTTPYTYSWTPGNASSAIDTGLCAGSYTVNVTDSNGCLITETYSLANPPVMTVSTITTPDSCYNDCQGTATASPTNGVFPYTYSWTDPSAQSTPTASGLCPGTYSVTVTDDHGCQASSQATITGPTQLALTLTHDNVSCFGACDGDIQAAVNGGTAPYTYSWTPGGATTSSINSLCPGTYVVTVTDGNGCTISGSVVITQPAALSATVSSNNVTCYNACNGSAVVHYTGGVAPYTVLWQPGLQNTDSVGNLCAGTYNVTVTDSNGCSVINSITITQPTAISLATNATTSNCGQSNGQACVTVTGGTGPFQYQWNDPHNQSNACANNLFAGSYTITVTDAYGCVDSASVTVNDISGPTVNISSSTDVTCAGAHNGSANASISGGVQPYTITWNPGNMASSYINNLAGGTYVITVTDSAGCSSSASVVINEPSTLVSAITASSNVSCYGDCNGSATIAANGGTTPYSYLWNDPATQTTTQASNLCAGSYVVTITDQNGCTKQDSVNITQPDSLSVQATSIQNVSCYGGNNGEIHLVASGGTPNYTYSWLPNVGSGPVVTNLYAGSYTVTVTDTHGCSIQKVYTITQPTQVTLSIQSNASTCGNANGSLTVSVNGGVNPYTYAWNDPSSQTTTTAANLSAGQYNVIVTDQNGCSKNINGTVNNISGPTIDSVTTINAKCNGAASGLANANVSGGTQPYTYLWSDSSSQTSPTASALYAGIYTVTVTDANGCVASSTVNITQPAPVQEVTSTNDTVCYGQIAQVYASAFGGTPGYTYHWNNTSLNGAGPFNLNLTNSTNFTVYALDTNGCTSQMHNITITVLPPISIQAPNVAVCNGDNATVTALASGGNGGPYSYAWSNNVTGASQTITPSINQSPETLIVTVSDGCSTDAIDTVEVNVNPLPVAFLAGNDTTGCAPLTVDFSGFSDIGVSYLWNFGDSTALGTTQNPVHTYTSPGTYDVTLTVTSGDSCKTTITESQYINVYPVPVASFTSYPNPTTVVSPTITFTDQSQGANSWHWNFGESSNPVSDSSSIENPTHTYNDTGTYVVQLIVSNSYGCVDTAWNDVFIKGDYVLFAPTAFSPNGDGINDYFFPKGIGIDPNNFEMYIFDRWGNMIYKTDNLSKPWDGRANGGSNIAQEDVYVWLIITKDMLGNQHKYIGHVALIK